MSPGRVLGLVDRTARRVPGGGYRKLVAAACGAGATWLTTAVPGGVDTVEWAGLAAALLGVVAVWLVPNEPS